MKQFPKTTVAAFDTRVAADEYCAKLNVVPGSYYVEIVFGSAYRYHVKRCSW